MANEDNTMTDKERAGSFASRWAPSKACVQPMADALEAEFFLLRAAEREKHDSWNKQARALIVSLRSWLASIRECPDCDGKPPARREPVDHEPTIGDVPGCDVGETIVKAKAWLDEDHLRRFGPYQSDET